MCLLGDRLYAVGGYDGQQYIKDVESYDPVSNEWSKVLWTIPVITCSMILIASDLSAEVSRNIDF